MIAFLSGPWLAPVAAVVAFAAVAAGATLGAAWDRLTATAARRIAARRAR